MSEEKILTLHPDGKKGVNILKRRYDQIRDFILQTIKEQEEISFEELTNKAVVTLRDTFDGKVSWYIVNVKLDLEARNVIERFEGIGSHRLKLKK